MYETHSGTRPARPTLAVVLSAAVLLAALGAAWFQVRSSLALAPAVRISGTNLIVRPPKGWRQRPDQPGTFQLVVRGGPEGRADESVARAVRFDTGRLWVFAPLDPRAIAGSSADPPIPKKIGPLPGAQLTRARVSPFSFRNVNYRRETIVRWACSPRGDYVLIEYFPVAEPTPGDLELMDSICAGVRLDEPALQVNPADAFRHAGLACTIDSAWQVAGPDFPEVHGLYIMETKDGFPAWSLGVFRTWLADGRAPEDLLADFAAEYWALPDAPAVHPSSREDGAALAWIEFPSDSTERTLLPCAMVLARSSSEAVLIFAAASEVDAPAALQACRKLADRLEFTNGFPALDQAAEAGRALASTISERGAQEWWGLQPVESFYVGLHLSGSDTVEPLRVWRSPPSGSTPARFKGGAFRGSQNHVESDEWEAGNDFRDYVLRTQGVRGATRIPIETVETAKRGTKTVERSIRTPHSPNERPKRTTLQFDVGPDFVCPPAEEIAESVVAHATDNQDRIISASTRFGRGAHSRLLRPLSRGQNGEARTLLVCDHFPRGTILAYDDANTLVFQSDPGFRLERLTRDEFIRRFGDLR